MEFENGWMLRSLEKQKGCKKITITHSSSKQLLYHTITDGFDNVVFGEQYECSDEQWEHVLYKLQNPVRKGELPDELFEL